MVSDSVDKTATGRRREIDLDNFATLGVGERMRGMLGGGCRISYVPTVVVAVRLFAGIVFQPRFAFFVLFR